MREQISTQHGKLRSPAWWQHEHKEESVDGAVLLNYAMPNIFTKNQKSILRCLNVCVNRWSTNTSEKHKQTVLSVYELFPLIQNDAFRSNIWSALSAGQSALQNNSPPPAPSHFLQQQLIYRKKLQLRKLMFLLTNLLKSNWQSTWQSNIPTVCVSPWT